MDKINVLFKKLVIDKKSEIEDWISSYVSLVSDVEKVRKSLRETEDIELDANYKDLSNSISEKNYRGFLEVLFANNPNGIASDQMSCNMIRSSFDKVARDPELKSLLKESITDNGSRGNELYEKTMEWWKRFSKDNQINKLYRSIINRLFAAIYFKKLGTTINETYFSKAESELSQNCGYKCGEAADNSWFQRNEELTSWLDKALSEDLESLVMNVENEIERELSKCAYRNTFIWLIYENGVLNSFSLSKNKIYYGPPGTGKTYLCNRDAKNHFEFWKASFGKEHKDDFKDHMEIIQFHPTYTYEDFIEGLRPVPDNSNTKLKLVNGIFKEFCRRASKWELELLKVFPDCKNDDVWKEMKVDAIINRKNDFKKFGKHWDFLEGVANDYFDQPVEYAIPPFYFIVDEINRAELSRVLGELMYCLEYRGVGGKTKTQYSQLHDDKADPEGKFFFIPHNVYFLGTMNNIDRSVESFDFALRRRFSWERKDSDYDVIREFYKEKKCEDFMDIAENLESLNKAIEGERMLGKDFQIGHAYVMNFDSSLRDLGIKELRKLLWTKSIRPLLEEYLRGLSDAKEIEGKLNSLEEEFKKKMK